MHPDNDSYARRMTYRNPDSGTGENGEATQYSLRNSMRQCRNSPKM